MKVTDILKDGEIKQLEIRARNSWFNTSSREKEKQSSKTFGRISIT
jgi:hypothetical protein